MEGLIIALTLPLLGTMTGAAFVFFMKHEMPALVQKSLLGFASGVMVAASVWSLLIPGMELSGGEGWVKVMPVAAGFLCGIGFLLAIDYLTPHLHIGGAAPEGPRSRLSRTAMLSLAVTIHNLPEGMAVGLAAAAAALSGVGLWAGAGAIAFGVGIQNIPEGAAVSLPALRRTGSRRKALAAGVLSGAVEPVGGLAAALLAGLAAPALPWLLAFAAGAMVYAAVSELIPSACGHQKPLPGIAGTLLGFGLMMALDMGLG